MFSLAPTALEFTVPKWLHSTYEALNHRQKWKLIRKKKIPERAERKRKMFGKEVVVPAKPAVERITVQVVKPLYTSVQTAL